MNARFAFGRIFYAVAVIAFGIQHLIHGAFVTRVVPSLPDWIPAHTVLAYLCGALLGAIGIALLARIRLRTAGLVLATLLTASVVLLYLPSLAANPYQPGVITNTFKAIALCGGALVLINLECGGIRTTSPIDRLLPCGRYLFASFLIVAGVQHFMYAPFVATLVPAWVPPSQLFWTWLAGAALIAGGLGIMVPQTTRLAATLTGVMIFLWVPMLHIPRALADLHNANETTAVFEALAMSGIAFMIAAHTREARFGATG